MFTRGNPDGIEFPRAPWSNECWFLVGTSLNSFDKNVCLGNFTLKTRMGKRVCVRIFIACEALNRCKSESFSVLLLWYPALSCCKFYSMTVFVVLYIYACVCLWQFGGTNQNPTWKNVVFCRTQVELHDTFEIIAWSNVMSNNVLIMA